MKKIRLYERRVLAVQITGFSIAFFTSVVLVIIAWVNLDNALASSGCLNFASLFFSDFSIAIANFQDFAFSMMESFPVFSAAFFVGGMIVSIWSATHLIDDIGAVRERHSYV